jgi:hypothetical protein
MYRPRSNTESHGVIHGVKKQQEDNSMEEQCYSVTTPCNTVVKEFIDLVTVILVIFI